MTWSALWESVMEDARRGTRALLGGALGIALGLAALVFFGALGLGVKDGVLKKALARLPVSTIEVRPKGGLPVGFLRFEGSELLMRTLDENAVEALRTTPGVKAVHPRVAAVFPMRAQGGKSLVGRDVYTDVFASGVDVEFLQEDLPPGTVFRDTTEGPIPAVVSTQLLELFNRAVAPSLGVPGLNPEAVMGFAFTLVLNESYSSGKTSGGQRVTVQVVGVSDKAMLLGITVPRATVERWNKQFAETPKGYASAYVVAEDGASLSTISKTAEAMGYVVEQNAKFAGYFITALMLTWMLVAVLILVVAAFNVAQTLKARVQSRRKELGLMRAVGARRKDIRSLILAEALLVGGGAAVLGLVMGVAGGWACDLLAEKYLPRFPFWPETFFQFPPWLLGGALAAALISALAGAWPPAREAARVDPARALEG
ncbi:MAG: ABC transporter permease [Myxococcota bacterium]